MADAERASPEVILEPEWQPTPEQERRERREILGFASGIARPTSRSSTSGVYEAPVPMNAPSVNRSTRTAASSAARLALITQALSDPNAVLDTPPVRSNKRSEVSEGFETNTQSKKSKDSLSGPSSLGGPSNVLPANYKRLAGVFLSKEQRTILGVVEKGESVFFTGSAGTGKSVLLREIIASLKRKYSDKPGAVAVTASTGLASCNIGGITVHSFAGLGPNLEPADAIVKKLKKIKLVNRWTRLKCLIIDEISMTEAEVFELLHQIAIRLRAKTAKLPFGGIQMIVTGDFFQLPPVTKLGEPNFAFESTAWKETFKHSYNLTQVFRQRDPIFIEMLNEMRFGSLSQSSILRFRALSRELSNVNGLRPMELFPLKVDVELSNQRRLSALPTNPLVYKAIDGGVLKPGTQRTKMLDNLMAPETLRLKVQAQVMLIKNLTEVLVNGSIGHVVSFVDPSTFYGDEASALNLKVPRKFEQQRFPLVKFKIPAGGTETIPIVPQTFKTELPDGTIQVSRTQVPLILAWAISIHKAQGQSLYPLKVDMGRVFEKGQAYVALSRALSLDGLQVLNFKPELVKPHPKVVEWTKSLTTIA